MAIREYLHKLQFEKLTTPVELHPVTRGTSPLRTSMPVGRTKLDPGQTTTYMTPAGFATRADVEHKTDKTR
jgi:hypothetical protein